MLNNNLDILVEQVNQHRQELLTLAKHKHLIQHAGLHQPSLLGQTLTYVGDLLVTSGQWLKGQGELPTPSRTVVTQ